MVDCDQEMDPDRAIGPIFHIKEMEMRNENGLTEKNVSDGCHGFFAPFVVLPTSPCGIIPFLPLKVSISVQSLNRNFLSPPIQLPHTHPFLNPAFKAEYHLRKGEGDIEN